MKPSYKSTERIRQILVAYLFCYADLIVFPNFCNKKYILSCLFCLLKASIQQISFIPDRKDGTFGTCFYRSCNDYYFQIINALANRLLREYQLSIGQCWSRESQTRWNKSTEELIVSRSFNYWDLFFFFRLLNKSLAGNAKCDHVGQNAWENIIINSVLSKGWYFIQSIIKWIDAK